MWSLQVAQARKYRLAGIGFGGAMLKHSLYPLGDLRRVLPTRGCVVDLGCGEGMLTNLLAEALPGARFIGVDRDPDRIAVASRVASRNASFVTADIAACQVRGAAAVIFNDVLHHHPPAHQARLLEAAVRMLDEDGVLILKEVDAGDGFDVGWTRFWDNRLYPDDVLHFRSRAEWLQVVRQQGFRVLEHFRVPHPWPASRSVVVATRRPRTVTAPPAAAPLPAPPVHALVTGATGFMGEHLVRELLRLGLEGSPVRPVLVVRDPAVLARDLREHPDVEVLEGDLRDVQAHAAAIARCAFVFHLAARVDFFAGREVLEENLAPLQRLLAVCAPSKVRRFVYASTIGAVDRQPGDPCTTPLDENSPAHSVSYYGQSKLEGERLVAESGLPYTTVRIPWCYGPGMAPTHHVRALFERVAGGSPASWFNWPGRVSLIEVGAASRTLMRLAVDPASQNGLYCLTDGAPLSFGALFGEMGRMCGRRTAWLPVPAALVSLARLCRRWIPFQLKCLLLDGLAASSAKLVAAGHLPDTRAADFLEPLARYVRQERHPSRHRARVLVTGAAGGIGRALALELHRRGYGLLLVDRNETALRELTARLGADSRVVDLSDEAACQRLVDELREGLDDVETVVNNAGIGARGHYETIAPERHVELLRVNCLAPMQITSAVLPKMLAAGSGTVVNVASSAAFQPLPYMAVYAASKAFVLSYSQALAGELRSPVRRGVRVVSIVPSGTQTGFQHAAGVRDTEGLLGAGHVALRIARALDGRRHTVLIGHAGRAMSIGARVTGLQMRPLAWEFLMRHMR